jgi:hypothetical protein
LSRALSWLDASAANSEGSEKYSVGFDAAPAGAAAREDRKGVVMASPAGIAGIRTASASRFRLCAKL